MMSSRKETFEALFDMANDAMEFIEDNEEKLQKILGNSNEFSMDEQSPLKEAQKLDDKVIFVAETPGDGISSISTKYYEKQNKLEVDIGGDTVTLLIPEDCIPNEAEANISNGILQLDIPREEPKEMEIDTQTMHERPTEEDVEAVVEEETGGSEEQNSDVEGDEGGEN
jgi:HSP20 family molecular chaperone IbpA